MLRNSRSRFACILSIFFVLGCAAWTQDTHSSASDNTKVNQGDRNGTDLTADQQKMDRTDRDLTQQIRKSIVSDKSLSTYAHNIKIISQNGQVTLKGPVRSDEEKQAVESKAAAIAGQGKVTSEITVKPQS